MQADISKDILKSLPANIALELYIGEPLTNLDILISVLPLYTQRFALVR